MQGYFNIFLIFFLIDSRNDIFMMRVRLVDSELRYAG